MKEMIPDLKGKSFCLFGLKDTGKTTLAKFILASEPAHFVFDTMHEYKGFNRYLVDRRDSGGIPELEAVITRFVLGSKGIRLFVVDEANRYCRPFPTPLPQAVRDLNDFTAHVGISFGSIARRPVQLHTDIVELAAYLFIFNLKGKNDIGYLNDLSRGLGDAVVELPPYSFAVVYPDRSFEVHPPITPQAWYLTKKGGVK